MDVKEIGKYLGDVTAGNCSDEEFAEAMVYIYRFAHGNDKDLTAAEMNSFDVKEFTKWLGDILDEIIYSTECDTSAWWKKDIEEPNYKVNYISGHSLKIAVQLVHARNEDDAVDKAFTAAGKNFEHRLISVNKI